MTLIERSIQLLKVGWCKGAFARDADGRPVNYMSGKACSWCLSGAIRRAAQEAGADSQQTWIDTYQSLSEMPSRWNDSRSTVDEVITFLRSLE